MLKNVLQFIKNIWTPRKCGCGNPKSCKGKYRFLVLYDIKDYTPPLTIGSPRLELNYERAGRCSEFLKDHIALHAAVIKEQENG